MYSLMVLCLWHVQLEKKTGKKSPQFPQTQVEWIEVYECVCVWWGGGGGGGGGVGCRNGYGEHPEACTLRQLQNPKQARALLSMKISLQPNLDTDQGSCKHDNDRESRRLKQN